MTGALSSLERRLLNFVTDDEQSATEIYRHFYGLPDGNLSFTSRMRRERRECAARLEDLAEWGWIERGSAERHGAEVPTYFKRPRTRAGRPGAAAA